MTPTVRLALVIAALLAVAACSGPAVSGPAAAMPVAATAATPPDTTPPDTTPPAAEEPAMTCQADKGQWAIGQIADEALVAKVQAETTSESVRVIKPGMMVTMDYRDDRVNLDVDDDNRVTAVRCT
ncbi:MAG: hypothetical protein DCF27_06210 [Lysobacteraceae bacterium]|nr:MAG: hypothetical protein DCF27_06210 [Xanthomonadaceae bacterium]